MNSFLRCLLVYGCVTFTQSITVAQKQNNAAFAMFRNNSELTGETTWDAIYGLKGIKFRYQAGGPIRSTPAIFNGTIYFGCGDGYFYALDKATGRECWKFKTTGAIYSSPAVSGTTVYFSSRDGYLYALETNKGKVTWKYKMGKDLGKENYWDNYLSSPVIKGATLFTGSGDGFLYAVNRSTGKVIWKYDSGARIRTTPSVSGNHVVFGNNVGVVISLDAGSGNLQWKFATDGAYNTFESKSNDRKSIFCSASISNGVVVTGGRDGIIYALDLKTGKEKWRNDHKGPWILSTAIKDGVAYVGCGSDYLLQALDLNTGAEKWRLKVPSAIFSSITIAGGMLYFNDLNFSGNLHAVNGSNGVEQWSFPMGSRSFSTPVIAGGIIYCGTEDGLLYALQGNTPADSSIHPGKKFVYWEGKIHKNDFSDFQNGIDEYIRDYFAACGYKLIDAAELEQEMKEQLTNPANSVIVFADNRFPLNIVDDKSGKPLVLQYLEAHGKIALFGLNPIAYTRDSSGRVVRYDDSIPGAVFGLKYVDKNFIRGIYQSHPTIEANKSGLFTDFTTVSNFTVIEPGSGITPLATDEFGSITEWIKNYGGAEGTGLLQLNIPSNEINFKMGEMRAVIEYGVNW
ncbi:PQQ-binding-like beta-propeller repeat protein [Ginsengibacter hankyongi]|uniref:PQQ-binding-like beta-propeller repeat protein n=1 Tax=Ginsengibacter hankyongi TaxID=2607284 RepID=A0A5J5IL61_9BACT|nr:PQQ-binding-like beta-propeller repeat protein [Ginsengibacter hankyongi]KAA9040807.1 PQQ-binding-like beta-propeller repeat protein [Ginsengibacter hankyongi]